MPADPLRILKLCQEIEETTQGRLREMDKETLLGIRKALQELKRQVDRTLLRLFLWGQHERKEQ
jgi:hypothetical protein